MVYNIVVKSIPNETTSKFYEFTGQAKLRFNNRYTKN